MLLMVGAPAVLRQLSDAGWTTGIFIPEIWEDFAERWGVGDTAEEREKVFQCLSWCV